MSDFDFAAIKPVTVKAADVPKIKRPRALAHNPLAEHFAKSMAKVNAEGEGVWLSLPNLPIVDPSEKNPMGEVVRKALAHLRNAADNAGKGMNKQLSMNEDGTVTLYFQSKPKGTRNVKPKTEEDKA